jgi:hypothetical protein
MEFASSALGDREFNNERDATLDVVTWGSLEELEVAVIRRATG